MTEPVVEPQFYTRKEVSIMSRISVGALQCMATEGRGPECFKPAGYSCVLYPKAQTEAWMRGESGQESIGPGRGGVRVSADKPKRLGRRSKKEEVSKRMSADTQCQNNVADQHCD